MEVEIERLARRTLPAFLEGEVLLLPVEQMLRLAEIHVETDSAIVRARLPWRDASASVDATRRVVFVGPSRWSLDPDQTFSRDGTVYLATGVLERILDARLQVDWAELRVTATAIGHLPLARRIARERSRLAVATRRAPVVDRRYGTEGKPWDGVVLDWSVFVPDGLRPDATAYRAGLGAQLLGGSLEVEVDHSPASGRPGDGARAAWLAVWPDARVVKQLRLGDVAGAGPRSTLRRGITLTNAPFARAAVFGEWTLTGRYAPGTEVELYRNDELVGFAETAADGAYRLTTQVQYGLNPLELRAFGPDGELDVVRRAGRIDRDRLPAGDLEYGLSAGVCRQRRCRAAENVDLHYGLSDHWTLRGGLEAFQRRDGPSLLQPYVVVSGSLDQRWLMRAEGLWRGLAAADVSYEPTTDFGTGGGWVVYDRDVMDPILTPVGRRWEAHGFIFWRPSHSHRTLFLRGEGRRVAREASTSTIAGLDLSARTGRASWLGRLSHERRDGGLQTTSRTFAELTGSTVLRAGGVPLLDRLFLRASTRTSMEPALERLELLLARSFRPGWRVEVRTSWRRGARGPAISLGFNTELPWARSFWRLTRAPDGSAAAVSSTEGSVIWNSASGAVETAPGRSIRRGGVGGTVFLDADADGRLDAGEEPLPGVRLAVGGAQATTDADGRFSIWDLLPFQDQMLTVDSLSFSNPLWVPPFGLASVALPPNAYRRLDIPIVAGGELEGRVSLAEPPGGPRPVAGVELEVCHLESGRCISTHTFADGGFYVVPLPPGEYEVSVAREALEELGAARGEGRARVRLGSYDRGGPVPFVEIELTGSR